LLRFSSLHATTQKPPADDVLVFAAASLKEVLDEIAIASQPSTGATVRVSYAASSALARQIEAGAPAPYSSRRTSNGWTTWLASS
jgi:molybdate transport system substrate-binding protein